MADVVSIDDTDGRALVVGSDGFRAVRVNDAWSSSGSILLTGSDLAESFRAAAGAEASELSKAARAAVSS